MVKKLNVKKTKGLQPIVLPAPEDSGRTTVVDALRKRSTSRNISSKKLPIQMLLNLLWAAFGVFIILIKERNLPEMILSIACLSTKLRISMDSKGRAFDNIFVERLWRSVKYEDIYIKGYETMTGTACGLRQYFEFYNGERFHQALDYKEEVQKALADSFEFLPWTVVVSLAAY
jgi:hypothetical protein